MLKAQLGDKFKRNSLATCIDDLLQREINETADPSLAPALVFKSLDSEEIVAVPSASGVLAFRNPPSSTRRVHLLYSCGILIYGWRVEYPFLKEYCTYSSQHRQKARFCDLGVVKCA